MSNLEIRFLQWSAAENENERLLIKLRELHDAYIVSDTVVSHSLSSFAENLTETSSVSTLFGSQKVVLSG